MNLEDGKWLSIVDYSQFKNKSISTVRRYIKANRLKYKEENGKYYVWARGFVDIDEEFASEKQLLKFKMEIQNLKQKLRLLEEENNELNMLVSVLEQKLNSPPDLPKSL